MRAQPAIFWDGGMKPPKAPVGLGSAGRRLWRDVRGAYELRPDEQRMLTAACRTADELEQLEAALKEAEPVTAGSKGQARPHPLYAEVRAHRLTLRQLLVAVGLEEADAGHNEGTARSHAGRQLARKRWDQRGTA